MDSASIDNTFIQWSRKAYVPMARLALFVIFFWFGLLKVLDSSPAAPMVRDLLAQTHMTFMNPPLFVVFFGLFEMLIGLLFIIPKCERLALTLFFIQMVTTVGPLLLLPSITWSGFLVPTLEGQYIIKNLALIACALSIAANMKPLTSNRI